MTIRISVVLLLVALFMAACSPTHSAIQTISTSTPVQSIATDEIAPTPTQPTASTWKLELVAEDLEVPWSMVFTSRQRVLVSERAGRIREVIEGQLNSQALYTFTDVASQDEAGLMGLALDPDYMVNAYLYACYTTQSGGTLVNRVMRLIDKGSGIEPDAVILDNIPAARFHAGCRLRFGPDGKLYVTAGDALQPQAAQDLTSLAGKILRINADGSIPADNPFADSPVYSYGHRNPQGLDWQTGTGLLYATEHGPSGFDGPEGGDEINLIRQGGNYGWPLVSHNERLEGAFSPIIQFTPAVAPASALFYHSDVLPMFTGDFFFGALRGEGLVHVIFSEENPEFVEKVEWLVADVGRVRDVVEGPDRLIYFSTSNRDGRGEELTGDDKIYRLAPVYE